MSLERLVDEADAGQLPVLIAEWSRADPARRWIARALRLDLALLVAHPELVVPCLQRRCGHHQAAGPLVDAWTAAWGQGGAWLRAVRPPPVPLGAGALEEYRTSLPGALWCAADGATLGVIGEDGTVAIAWERATGRTIAAPRAPARAARWQLGRRRAGAIALGGHTIPIDDDETPDALFELDARLVVVAVTCERYGEYEAGYYLVDAVAGVIGWRGAGPVAAALAVAEGILIAGDGTLVLRDHQRGHERGAWYGPPITAMAAPSDGVLATRTGDVIRIWDRAAMPETLPWPRGRALVQISPDGARVLTGELLADGRTGRQIGTIQSTGHGAWLENGPPANAWLLRDTVFAQCLPWGLELWNTADGERFLIDNARGAEALDSVAIDRRGERLAIARSRAGTIELSPLRGGAVTIVATGVLGVRPRLGFSSDGAQLWWETRAGERVVCTPGHTARRLAADEPLPEDAAPRIVVARDGLVALDGLTAVTDDRELVVSLDGAVLAGPTTHLVR